MSRKDVIESRIQEALSPSVLEVLDESHRHSSGKGAESHFNVTVVSEAFAGELRVARHRRIHALLEDELAAGLHALTLTLLTPDEWRARSEQAIASPGCAGGSAHLARGR
ncbi:MAG: BolA family transcriptional regulator [Myxococcales bacterium]|nr:BolA family transcriptional regulator [Myxococcales bacterium]